MATRCWVASLSQGLLSVIEQPVIGVILLLSLCAVAGVRPRTTAETQSLNPPSQGDQNDIVLFDEGWRFHRGGAQGAEQPEFNDAKWRPLDLPHDWSIEEVPGTNSPFSQNAISQVSGGFTTGGTGWYRKSFSLPIDQKGKRILIQFDGVYMNAEVWLNGQRLGNHPYGYTSFWFDLTDKIKFGLVNVLALKVENEGENSRWYSGSGIYRHVWLRTMSPAHIAQWGIYITTPEVSAEAAKVNVRTKLLNESDQPARITLVTKFVDGAGAEVAKVESTQTIEPGAAFDFIHDAVIKSPSLWSPGSPARFTPR